MQLHGSELRKGVAIERGASPWQIFQQNEQGFAVIRLSGTAHRVRQSFELPLEFSAVPEGAITVHPSPWYGKEGMQQYFSGPLGGIILLEKAAENRIRRMTPREAAGCLFTQLLITRRDADSVRRACALEQALLERTPLWLLQNRGDSAAAELCRDTLSKELTQL